MTLKREGTLSQLVLESIQESIRDGEFRPGEALPSERELAERYGVGKSSIREAVKMLQVLGVVETAQGRGTYLRRSVGPQILRPLLLDMMCCARAPTSFTNSACSSTRAYIRLAASRATEELKRRAREAFEGLSRAQRESLPGAEEFDRNFHLAILEATGNEFIIKTGVMIMELCRPHMTKSSGMLDETALENHGKDTRNILLRQNGRPRRSRREIYARLPPHARRFRGREGTARRVNRRKRCKKRRRTGDTDALPVFLRRGPELARLRGHAARHCRLARSTQFRVVFSARSRDNCFAQEDAAMLFHEKLALIKEIISVTGTALAREAGLAPSCVCRYLSAKNSPFRGGGAVTRLSRAAAALAPGGRELNALREAAGARADEKTAGAVERWLNAPDSGLREKKPQETHAPAARVGIAAKLALLMDSFGTSNAELARYANLDGSSVSRYRSGKRSVRSDDPILRSFCSYFAVLCKSRGVPEA